MREAADTVVRPMTKGHLSPSATVTSCAGNLGPQGGGWTEEMRGKCLFRSPPQEICGNKEEKKTAN